MLPFGKGVHFKGRATLHPFAVGRLYLGIVPEGILYRGRGKGPDVIVGIGRIDESHLIAKVEGTIHGLDAKAGRIFPFVLFARKLGVCLFGMESEFCGQLLKFDLLLYRFNGNFCLERCTEFSSCSSLNLTGLNHNLTCCPKFWEYYKTNLINL